MHPPDSHQPPAHETSKPPALLPPLDDAAAASEDNPRAATKLRFRWRTIPVAMFGFYALSFLLAGIVSAGLVGYWLLEVATGQSRPSPFPWRFIQQALFGPFAAAWMSIVTWAWWNNRWKLALLLTLLFFLTGETAARLGLIPD